MRKIERNVVVPPSSLSESASSSWKNFKEKKEVREILRDMQHGCCAYCEGGVYNEGHVEHFYPQNKYPERSLAWGNLFLSCNSRKHCGHYKDSKGIPYHPEDLIKPDEENPEHFFFFHSNGEARPRFDLSEKEQQRAEETLRVFNLNEGALQEKRRRAVKDFFRKNGSLLEEIMALDEVSRKAFLLEECKNAEHLPYGATLRHFLCTGKGFF